mgnify:CR=1 FL=1
MTTLFVIQIVANGAMKKIWPLFNMIQILLVIKEVAEFPPNVDIIMSSVSDIVNLKIIPPEYVDAIIAYISGKELEQEEIPKTEVTD